MAVKDNTTKMANITVNAREVDFVTRFAQNWDALRDIMGIMRPIKKTPGTKLTSYTASMTLQSGSVAEGDEIPYSLASVAPQAYSDITIEKYAKGVTIESVAKYGATIAVQKTDEEFLNQLQMQVLTKFYTFLGTATLTSITSTWQAALASAKGLVLDKFNKLRKSVTEVVGFANVLDFYDYLGSANITVQTQFGLTYVQNFMGYSTLFLLSAPDIPRGKVIATPVENIDLYYIDPSDSDFAQLGLQYTVDGETNLIGFHAEGKYSHAVGESYALMGMTLWAEYLDGIALVTVGGSIGSLTATSAAGTTSGTKLTVTSPTAANTPADWQFYIKAQASTAPSAPDYGTVVPDGWTKVVLDENNAIDNVGDLTSGHKLTMIAANATNQVVAASGAVTVVNHA